MVNEKDEVISQVAREEVYHKLLPHRIVHVMIFNDKGEMALQLRNNNLDYCPGHWATAACGHVHAGETYEQAAQRELEEELGITLPLKFHSKDWYEVTEGEEAGLKMFLGAFSAQSNGPFKLAPREVQRVEFVSLDTLWQMIEQGEKIHPESLFIFKKHFFN